MKKSPRTIQVPIVFDPTAEDAVARAKLALETRAKELLETFVHRVAMQQTLTGDAEAARQVYDEDQAELERLKAGVDAAQAALAEVCRVYEFRSLGFRRWRAMKADHPSKNKDLAFDLDALTPELLREASDLSAGEVEEILSSPEWSEGEVLLLVNAAVTVQS